MFFGLLFLVVIGYIVFQLANGKTMDEMFRFGAANPRGDSLRIAQERYARGEISRQEFQEMKDDLLN